MRLSDDVAENRLLTRWAELMPRASGQVGDVHETDAELVPLGDGRLLALTVDTVAEEIRLGLYRDPRTAGRIAVTAALSDLAAVGAEPLGLLLAVTLPADGRDAVQEAVARGAAEAARAAGTHVLGGDTNEGDLAISCTAAGLVPEASVVTRVGVRAGDLLYATGPLGLGAARAAAALFGDPSLLPEDEFAPPPRIAHGCALRGLASAAMDSSDGLVATLDQLARLNGVAVRVTVQPEALLEPRAAAAARRLGLPPLAFLAALHGEFELVFAVRGERREELAREASRVGFTPLLLGAAEEGHGIFLGDRPIDGAAFRNLLGACGGDPRAYVAALVRLAG